MTHCPQCGANVPPGADACSACGLVVSLVRGYGGGASPASKTIMGGVELGPLRQALPPAPKLDPSKTQPMSAPTDVARTQESMGNLAASLANTTIDDLTRTVVDPPRFQEQVVPYTLPSAGGGPVAGAPVSSTLMGGVHAPTGDGPPSAGLAGSAPSGRTLLGVATPGIAPLHPDRAKDAPQKPARDVAPMAELGATAVPVKAKKDRPDLAHVRIQIPAKPHPLAKAIRGNPAARGPKAASGSRKGKAIGLLAAAIVLVIGGVLTAVLWPSAPPLTMQVVSRDGVEKMAFTCASCPDGTVLRANGGEATVQGGRAEATSSAPLPVGDTQVRWDPLESTCRHASLSIL